MNGNNQEKWKDIENYLSYLNEQYIYPKIVYLDINTDIGDRKYKEWKHSTESDGWEIHESQTWTRKGYGKHKDTNIDIVATYNIEKESITLETLEHN